MTTIEESQAAENRILIAFLTIMYFVVEVVINYSIYKQLSFDSNIASVDVLEFWGKLVTGLGVALVITRIRLILTSRKNSKPAHLQRPVKMFLKTSLIAIPLSFFLQNQIIETIVDDSSFDQKNRAVLALATQQTIVPYYDFRNTNSEVVLPELKPHQKFMSPFMKADSKSGNSSYQLAKEAYSQYEPIYHSAADNCLPASRKTIGMQSGLDRAFFAFSALKTVPVNATKYKQLIRSHYSCLLDDKLYRSTHTANIPYSAKIIEEMYRDHYQPASERWATAATNHLQAANKSWRENLDNYFGFKTTLKPRTDASSYDYFSKHRDVRKYYRDNAGPDAKGLYPYDEGYDKRHKAFALSKLPGAIIPTYIDYDNLDESEDVGGVGGLHSNDTNSTGKAAYKAVVMPVVAMGLSAFFLVSNLILFTYAIVKKLTSAKGAFVYLIASMLWFSVYPIMPAFHNYDQNPLMENQSLPIKWLYYHESKLVGLYGVFQ